MFDCQVWADMKEDDQTKMFYFQYLFSFSVKGEVERNRESIKGGLRSKLNRQAAKNRMKKLNPLREGSYSSLLSYSLLKVRPTEYYEPFCKTLLLSWIHNRLIKNNLLNVHVCLIIKDINIHILLHIIHISFSFFFSLSNSDYPIMHGEMKKLNPIREGNCSSLLFYSLLTPSLP